MSQDRVVEDYRKHQLLAALVQGVFKGRVWDTDKKLILETSGNNIEELLTVLRNFVDEKFVEKAETRTQSPEAAEYVKAFQGILGDLPDSYISMLKAHYNAPNRTLTATQLAKAGGYKTYSTANLHYGLLGKRLYEELPIVLPKRDDGSLIYTGMIAVEGEKPQDETQWKWKMREEVADAINGLGLHN